MYWGRASPENRPWAPTPMPLHVCAHTPFRGPWACRRKGGGAVQSPSVPTAPYRQPPGGAGPGSWGGEQELSLEPTPAFSVGAWKPLGAGVAPALPLRDRLGIPGRSGPPLPAKPHARPGSSQSVREDVAVAPPRHPLSLGAAGRAQQTGARP